MVIITTKKGKKGFKADVELQYGVSEVPKKLDLMSPDEYRVLFFEYTMRALLAGIPVDGAGVSATNLGNLLSEENLETWYTDLVELRNTAVSNGETQVSYTFPNNDELTMSTNNPIFRNTYNTDCVPVMSCQAALGLQSSSTIVENLLG